MTELRDELFSVLLNSDDPIVNGKRVWAPGLMYYIAHGGGDDVNLRDKIDPADSRGPLPILLLSYDAGVRVRVNKSKEPYQSFWLQALPKLFQDLFDATREPDVSKKVVDGLVWMVHAGVMFLLRTNPYYAGNDLQDAIDMYDEFLFGRDFSAHNDTGACVVAWLLKLRTYVKSQLFSEGDTYLPLEYMQPVPITSRNELWEYCCQNGMIPVISVQQGEVDFISE